MDSGTSPPPGEPMPVPDPTVPPVALDAMGGDHAPAALVDGAARAVREGYPVVLVGDEEALRPLVPRDVDLAIRHAPEVVGMDEAPMAAVRKKTGASVRVIMDLVKEGAAGAAVSCGNTGAAMAAALIVLGRVPGVDRPAICTVVPRSDGGQVVVLDLGANVDCRPSHLAQFAVMGSAFARAVIAAKDPRVGLLSNGEEDGKGNEQVRAAAELIRALPVRFVGNVEPRGALSGACEVLVCDGFVGNILLKTVEATAELAGTMLKQELTEHPTTRFAAMLLAPALKRFRKRTDYAAIGGALLLGTDGVVVIGHGRAGPEAVLNAVRYAHHCAADRMAERLQDAMATVAARA